MKKKKAKSKQVISQSLPLKKNENPLGLFLRAGAPGSWTLLLAPTKPHKYLPQTNSLKGQNPCANAAVPLTGWKLETVLTRAHRKGRPCSVTFSYGAKMEYFLTFLWHRWSVGVCACAFLSAQTCKFLSFYKEGIFTGRQDAGHIPMSK